MKYTGFPVLDLLLFFASSGHLNLTSRETTIQGVSSTVYYFVSLNEPVVYNDADRRCFRMMNSSIAVGPTDEQLEHIRSCAKSLRENGKFWLLDEKQGNTRYPTEPSSWFCDFESDDECFMTGKRWITRNRPTRTSGTGPDFAFHGETFTYMEANYLKEGESAWLVSTSLPGDSLCFHLPFHMYGSGIGSLEAILEDHVTSTLLFERQGQQSINGSDWRYKVLDIPQSLFSRTLSIRAYRGSSTKGDIALDALRLMYGECQLSYISPLGCGEYSFSKRGNLLSPDFPISYPSQSHCTWQIEAPFGMNIQLRVNYFQMPHDDCRDNLTIYEGVDRMGHTYCEKDLSVNDTIPIHSNILFMIFLSSTRIEQHDVSGEGMGFNISWSSESLVCQSAQISGSNVTVMPRLCNNRLRNVICEAEQENAEVQCKKYPDETSTSPQTTSEGTVRPDDSHMIQTAGQKESLNSTLKRGIGIGFAIGLGIAVLIVFAISVILYRKRKNTRKQMKRQNKLNSSIHNPEYNPSISTLDASTGLDNYFVLEQNTKEKENNVAGRKKSTTYDQIGSASNAADSIYTRLNQGQAPAEENDYAHCTGNNSYDHFALHVDFKETDIANNDYDHAGRI